MWIVKEVGNGSRRWVKYNVYNIEKLRELLWKKMYTWWYPLSTGHIVIIDTNKKYKIVKLQKKSMI